MLVALGLRFGHSGRHLTPQAGLSFVGIPTVTTGGVSFSITNESNSMIDYGTGPLQVKSNGVWRELQPLAAPFTRLAAGQAGTIMAVAPSNAEAWRVPVIWVRAPNKWQVLKKRAEFTLTGGGSWNLVAHTNLSPEITR